MKKRTRENIGLVFANIFLILLCFVVLVPVLYAFSVSLNADNSLLSTNFSFLPKHFTLANYKAVFTEKPIMLWLKNSLILAVVTLGISLEQEFRRHMFSPERNFRAEKQSFGH